MKVGDKVRLLRVPPGVKDDGDFKTRTMLAECIGLIFTIQGFQAGKGKVRLLEFDMSEAFPERMDTIWVESDCVEAVKNPPTAKV